MNRQASTLAIFAAFFLSGVASLTCEVVWFKLFGLVLGNSTQSASTVVTVFFVGLGIGAIASGRLTDRLEQPLLVYGVLELLLAGVSLGTTLVLSRWSDWITWFTPYMGQGDGSDLPVKLALAFALLGPPTLLMGSTLPLLSRWIVQARQGLGSKVALLYTVNTMGAAVGCAWVGFVGVGTLGLWGSGLVASGIYLLAGVTAVALSVTGDHRVALDATPQQQDGGSGLAQGAGMLIVAFGLSGFISVAYEILWFRLLATATLNTVYVFASLLVVYLFGLVVGAAVVARWLRTDRPDLLQAFIRLQLAIALFGVVTLALLGRARSLLAMANVAVLEAEGIVAVVVLAMIVLLPPCTLIGMTFPIAAELTVQRLSSLGSRIGLVYGANTIIGAMGSLSAGFLFIPLLGTQGTALLLAMANLALAGALALYFTTAREDRVLRREIAATVGFLAFAFVWLGPRYLQDSQTQILDAELLDYREAADGTFVMVKYEEYGVEYQQVIVNGTSYANNRPPGRHYMALLAHLPILLHDDPEQVVVICIGTGTTVGATSISDRVGRVAAVDLSREIFELAPHFVPWNHAFHESPKVDKIVADGRHFLLSSDRAFDVLTFEPPPPIEAGVANLYTVEFYQLARRRARAGALMAQWIPVHQGFQELQRQLVKSVMVEYPHTSLWMTDNQEAIVIGADKPLQIDPVELARRMAEPDVKAELHDIGIDSVEDLLALFVVQGSDLEAWVGDAPPISDNLPTVERFLGYEADPFSTPELLAHRTPVTEILTGPPLDPARAKQSREAMKHLWLASDAAMLDDFAGAIAEMERALAFAPDNVYFAYRLREYRDRLAKQN